MAKRLLTVTLAIMLVFALTAITASAQTPAEIFVDAGGDDGEETGKIRNIGDFNSEIKGGKLWFNLADENRGDGDNYSFFEFVAEEFEDGNYKIIVGFNASKAAVIRLSTPGSPWRVWTQTASIASGEITLDVTVEDGKFISTNTINNEGVSVAADKHAYNGVRFTVDGDGQETPSQPNIEITKMQVFKGNTAVFDVYAADGVGNDISSGANGGNGGTPPDGSKPVDTGIAGVAVASAVALLAAGAVIVSRKRK